MFSLEWPSTFSPFKQHSLSADERSWLEGFQCTDATCEKPSDRAILLGFIRDEWGGEESFERFVRDFLPSVFERSKQQYATQLSREVTVSLELLFSD